MKTTSSHVLLTVTALLLAALSTASAVVQVADSSGGNITIDTSTYAVGDSLLVIGNNTVTSTADLGNFKPGGTFTGDVNINSGTMKITGFYFGFTNPTPLGNLEVARNINVAAGATLLNAGQSLTGYANAQISAVLNINGGTVINNSPAGADYSYLTLNTVNFVNGGTLSAQGGNNLGNIVLNGTVSVSGTAAASITSSAPGNIVALSDAGPNPAYASGWTPNANQVTTFNVGATNSGGADLTVSAVLGDGWGSQARLTKTGSGTMALTATSTYTGATTVSVGTLIVSSTGSLASASAVSVSSGAALGGDGTVSGNLTLANGAKLVFDLNNTPLMVGGTFALNNSFGVASLVSSSLAAIDWSTVSVGTYQLLGTNFAFDATTITNYGSGNALPTGGKNVYFTSGSNILDVVVAVPEPATWALLAFSLTSVMVLRRRRIS